MSISTNYDDTRYTQYASQTSSTSGQQRIHHKRQAQQTNSAMELADNTTQNTTVNKPKSPLDSLVESGTITSDQEKAIRDAFEASRMAYQTQAGAANASNTFKNPLDSLVESGTITKGQEAAIKSAFDSDRKAHKMPPPPPPSQQNENSDPMSKTLDSFVTDGTITSEQKDTILNALQFTFQSNQEKTNTSSDPLDSLISSGTITKDQQRAFETAIKAYQAQAFSVDDTSSSSFEAGM